ncbi:MAG: heme-binding protein [Alphaproteobacteria bacterium]|uniref:GlcG/HbpS family heme-binding protein n=1 Tax=Marinobacter salarius TaxID=1420917 RepID=UPI0032ED1F79
MGLATALELADAARARSREMGFRPIAVVRVDDGGHTVASVREDGASLIRIHSAANKAWSCVSYGLATSEMGKRLATWHGQDWTQHVIGASGVVPGHHLINTPGGVVIRDTAGTVIGTIGVANAEDDEDVCLNAIAKVGLFAHIGAGEHG